MISQLNPSDFAAWRDRATASTASAVQPLMLDVREPWEVQAASIKEDGFTLLAHRAQQVITLEIEASLAESARKNLRKAGIYNAEVRLGDGAAKQTEAASGNGPLETLFDVIVLSGSVAVLPSGLLAQLKVGGRLSAIVGFEPVMRATLVTRVGKDAWRTIEAWDTVAPRLLNFPEPSKFTF